MPYTKQDVIARSGLPDRTIRNYIQRRLLPAPQGHGLAAEYDDEHMVRAVAIGRMRAQGGRIDTIAEHIAGWSTAKFKRFVAQTEPPAEEAPPSPPPPAPRSEGPEPVAAERVARAQLRRHEPLGDAELPDAPSWRIYSLITGIGLMVDADAPPIVHRVAAEILATYGRGRSGR
jgi:DNA-binding transcriptional MerR regulator